MDIKKTLETITSLSEAIKDKNSKLTESEPASSKPIENSKSLKDWFNQLNEENKPIPVVAKQGDTQSTGAGFLNITDKGPAGQAIVKALGDLAGQKKAQIVVPTTQQKVGQPATQQQTTATAQPAPAGATGQAPAGQTAVREKWGTETKVSPSEKGKYEGKTKAELLKHYNSLKKSGPHKKGSKEYGTMRELAFAIRAKGDWGKVKEEQIDELDRDGVLSRYIRATGSGDLGIATPGREEGRKLALMKKWGNKEYGFDEPKVKGVNRSQVGEVITKKTSAGEIISDFEKSKNPKFKGKSGEERRKMALGAYYSMHPEKSKPKKKTNEAERPSDDSDMGAGLGAGRNPKVLETSKKVNESMNHRKTAAYHEGRAHGLKGHAHNGKHYEDMEEARQYHEGYKSGLDECYGMGVYETAPAATVPGMASQSMAESHDSDKAQELRSTIENFMSMVNDMNLYGAVDIDRAVNALLKGNDVGKVIFDLIDYNITDGDGARPEDLKYHGLARKYAAMLDDLEMDIKHVLDQGMDEGNAFTAALAKTPKGGKFTLGGREYTDTSSVNEFAFESLEKQLNALLNEDAVSEGMSVSINTGMQGSPNSVSVNASDAEADKLLDFVKKAGLGVFGGDSGSSSDYGAPVDTAGHATVDEHDSIMSLIKKMSHGSDDFAVEKDEASNAESCSACGEAPCGCEVNEVETPDQELYQVAEDETEEQETTADENAEAEEDNALALKSVQEGGDGGEADEEPEMTEEEQINEWANEAGKKGTDEAFEADINFITKMISGGLNKPKSTGQTTIPVIAGQKSRMGSELANENVDPLNDWIALSGIKK